MTLQQPTSPSRFQRRTLWNAITALSLIAIGAAAVFVIWVVAQVLEFLQPVLVPLAVAAIIAFLIEPLISRLTARGVPRTRAMVSVYLGFLLVTGGMLAIIIPLAVRQAGEFAERRVEFTEKARARITEAVEWIELRFSDYLPAVAPADPAAPEEANSGDSPVELWLQEHGGELAAGARTFALGIFSGFLGLFGYIIGFFLVPVYLYYFLKESEAIKATWSDYLPLRQSRFRTELVDTLNEINGYLIAFFRGQMLVGIIDGILVGLFLLLMGLPYGLLIGVLMAMLGLLPYVGPLICWIPAVLISVAHFSNPLNQWDWLPQVWAYPLIVTGIFVVVQKIDSLFVAPRVVGDAVGLHPLTVIFSVLFWSLLIGGFLGALMAVPLTASLKVLFRRYVWQRKIQPLAEAQAAAAAAPGAGRPLAPGWAGGAVE